LRKLSGEALPTGPILVISTETKKNATEQLDQASFAGALQKSGLTQTAYDNILFTVTTAYGDARDGSRLINPLPATIPGLPEKEAGEYAATLLEYETNSGFIVRRANLPVYQKFSADLDILIEEYDSLVR